MKKTILLFFILSVLASPVIQARPVKPVLNQIVFNIKAEQWATTDSARVIVKVNATLGKRGLSLIHEQVLNNLKKISDKAPWHITAYDRRQTQSDLEQIQVTAESRLPTNALVDLREKAKQVSKPGETYKIDNILFSPSLAEIEKVRTSIRKHIYDEARNEITKLNQIYQNEHFQLHLINFTQQTIPSPLPKYRRTATLVATRPQPGLQVSDKIVIQAYVIAASKMNNHMKK